MKAYYMGYSGNPFVFRYTPRKMIGYDKKGEMNIGLYGSELIVFGFVFYLT